MRPGERCRFLALAAFLIARGAGAEPAHDAALHARRTQTPPTIDGHLDDAAWADAVPLRDFVQNFPDQNTAPTEQTEVRLLYDDRALYLAVRCDDRDPQHIVAPMARRDRADLESDFVAFQLDSRGDRRTSFGFAVSAGGVQFDGTFFNDNELSLDWDAVWDSATSRDDHGWSAELRIPLDVLRFDVDSVARWHAYVQRYISRRKESDEWPYLSRDTDAQVSRFAPVDGIDVLKPRRAIYLEPYVAGSTIYARRPSGDAADPSGTDVSGKVGGDAKLSITPALTLDVTVNPEFSQIEADQLVLNLTTFETYFREKRPFFLEGAEVFSPGVRGEEPTESPPLPAMQLFNSRRIGRTPDPSTATTGVVIGRVEPAAIAGAAKLSGHIDTRTTVAALDAITLDRDVTTDGSAGSGGNTRETLLPATNVGVLRVRRDVLGASNVGATFTATTPLDHRATFHRSFTGGADVALQTADHHYTAIGQVVASALTGGDSAHALHARDGTVIGDRARGMGGQLRLAKESGAHWLGKLYQEYESKRLALDDAGYLKRQNFARTMATLTLRELERHGPFVQSKVDVVGELTETADLGTNVGRRLLVIPEVTTSQFWTIGASMLGELRSFDVRETGDGVALERPAFGSADLYATTDTRRRVFTSAYVHGKLGGTYGGARVHGYGAGADTTLRIGTRTELLLGLLYFREVDPPRFEYLDATAPAPTYYLAPLDAQSASITLRGVVAITPRLTLQSFAQLFLAAGRFRGALSEQPTANAVTLDGLTPATLPAAAGDPDFHSVVLDANAVLRWDYRPGSILYVVLTHQQNDFRSPGSLVPLGLSGERDLRALDAGPSSTAILVKLTYFWKP